MARPKNMMIDGKAVKSVKINGQLWWRKSTEAVEWRLEGFSTDDFYYYRDFVDGIPAQQLRVVNNTNIPIEDYRIYDMSWNTPDYLDVSFYENYCDIAFNSWPQENPVELQFTEPSGTYSFLFKINLESLDISMTPQSIRYYGGRNNYFSPNTFKIISNVPVYDFSWDNSGIYDYFTLQFDGYNEDKTECKFSIYPIGEEAISLTDGNMYYIPFTLVDYIGYGKTERTIDLEIIVDNVQEEYTYRIEATDDPQYVAYYGSYWSATIPYRIYKVDSNGEEFIVEEDNYYYEKSTNGQTPPFEDYYYFNVTYWDPETDIETVLTLSGEAFIAY